MSNRSLLIVSLLIAVALVWIKGQERILSRTLNNIQVTLVNMPDNFILPEAFILPRTRVDVQGPRNTVEMIRPDMTTFRIDMETFEELDDESSVNIILSREMFRTNLERADQQRVSVHEESIHPRQVTLQLIGMEIDQPRPEPPETPPNQLAIPIYRLEKEVDVVIPTTGSPARNYRLRENGVRPTPSRIRVTGRYETLASLESVSTRTLDLSGITPDHPAIHLPLESVGEAYDIRPVPSIISGVTVTLDLTEEG